MEAKTRTSEVKSTTTSRGQKTQTLIVYGVDIGVLRQVALTPLSPLAHLTSSIPSGVSSGSAHSIWVLFKSLLSLFTVIASISPLVFPFLSFLFFALCFQSLSYSCTFVGLVLLQR